VTGDISKTLAGFNRIRTIVGLRAEYNWFSAQIKTIFSVRIQPKPDKYYVLELSSDPRGFRRETITLSSSTDPSRPRTVSEKRVEITDDFRFSLQFAKRIGAVAYRFGIKESSGGMGSDVYLWNDHVELSADLFDFRANVLPRLKLAAAMQFFRYLYVIGGFDDALNARNTQGRGGSGREYFLGAMLRFDDEDLRYMLMASGGAVSGAAGSQ
jgi:phospholipid/cholesterol/gamma-HCH transport system substrate-binding protein